MLIRKKKLFSGIALAGVLLTSSLAGVTSSQAAILDPQGTLISATTQSTELNNSLIEVSSSKVYSQDIRKAFNWTPTSKAITNADQIPKGNTIAPDDKKMVTPIVKKAPDSQDVTYVSQVSQTANKATNSPQKVVNPNPVQNKVPQVSRGSSDVDSLISRALSLQGIPYLWGGTSRKGFDCSGFVQYVFRASGISLPRTAAEQFKLGAPVDQDELRPGDLVFFQTYAPGATDVRIYIGGGRTVGASSEGISIHSLSESYWSKHYFGARRIR